MKLSATAMDLGIGLFVSDPATGLVVRRKSADADGAPGRWCMVRPGRPVKGD